MLLGSYLVSLAIFELFILNSNYSQCCQHTASTSKHGQYRWNSNSHFNQLKRKICEILSRVTKILLKNIYISYKKYKIPINELNNENYCLPYCKMRLKIVITWGFYKSCQTNINNSNMAKLTKYDPNNMFLTYKIFDGDNF